MRAECIKGFGPVGTNGRQAIDLLVEAIDLRFQSGNSVPVERAHIRADEWATLKAIVAAKGGGA